MSKREDRRRAKELEEARKAGTVPAQLDEEGNEINPHIPQYIAQAPWYLNKEHATLSHQRKEKPDALDKGWYKRGQRAGPAAKKFRKGACTNCGAMTHSKKDCLERPRKKGARWTQKDIQPDEIITGDLQLGYEGQRDRWNGYDPAEHARVMERHRIMEEERKKKRADALNSFMTEPDEAQKRFPHQGGGKGEGGEGGEGAAEAASSAFLLDDSDSDSEHDGDDVKLTGGEDMQGSKVDGTRRTTIRNLRLREDTAKYLYNLDEESAHYDPKTRSMREDPNPQGKKEVLYAGDNVVRRSGDVGKFEEMQSFAWEAAERGHDVHMVAAPSQAAIVHKQFLEKKEELEKRKKKSVLEKYGGEEYLRSAPKSLLFGQTEKYVEYAADGSVVQDGKKIIPRSKWEEDNYNNNHTQVWGSFWRDGQWGYACCHQTTKNSYCTGEAGRSSSRVTLEEMEAMQKAQEERLAKAREEKKREQEEKLKESAESREEKLERALKEEQERLQGEQGNERKRKYNSMAADSFEVSEEEMEAYRLKRQRTDDPMYAFLKGK